MKEVLVSINCITYNHEKYIAQAIESFLMQKTNFEFEILIHDDASNDRTQEIIRGYERKFPNKIKAILRNENQYSKGVKRIGYFNNHLRAKGKYIAWCEGDDYWTDSYKLQKQVDYMEKNDECMLVFHNAEKISDLSKKSEGYMIPLNLESKRCSIKDILELRFIPTASVMYRKKSLDNPPEWYFNAIVGDLPGNLISISKGYAYYINECMSVYRVENMDSAVNQWSKSYNNIDNKIKHCQDFLDIINNFDEYTNGKYADEIEDIRLYWLFHQEKYKGNISELKSEKFKNIYKDLTLKNKFIIYLIKISPNTYIKLCKLIFDIKNKMQKRCKNGK